MVTLSFVSFIFGIGGGMNVEVARCQDEKGRGGGQCNPWQGRQNV